MMVMLSANEFDDALQDLGRGPETESDRRYGQKAREALERRIAELECHLALAQGERDGARTARDEAYAACASLRLGIVTALTDIDEQDVQMAKRGLEATLAQTGVDDAGRLQLERDMAEEVRRMPAWHCMPCNRDCQLDHASLHCSTWPERKRLLDLIGRIEAVNL
jgi:hypothetical protein